MISILRCYISFIKNLTPQLYPCSLLLYSAYFLPKLSPRSRKLRLNVFASPARKAFSPADVLSIHYTSFNSKAACIRPLIILNGYNKKSELIVRFCRLERLLRGVSSSITRIVPRVDPSFLREISGGLQTKITSSEDDRPVQELVGNTACYFHAGTNNGARHKRIFRSDQWVLR